MAWWQWVRQAIGGHWVPEGGVIPVGCALTYVDVASLRYCAHAIGWHIVVRAWHVTYGWLRAAGVVGQKDGQLMFVALRDARHEAYERGHCDGDAVGYARGWREGGLNVVRQLLDGLDQPKES